MVFQDLPLWLSLTVLNNMFLGLASAGLSRRVARLRAHDVFSLCGIEGLAWRKPGQVSRGEQQRVALVRAPAMHPLYLLLDEPFASLDLLTKGRLLKELHALATKQSATVILGTYDLMEAPTLWQSAVVLETGRGIETGLLRDLLREPAAGLLVGFQQ
jgi:ABC-type nitrate/sulfonate/bicarbonate transport system ATPase subunit